MASFDWKGLINTVAPLLGTALGSPLAGMAISIVSQALLGKADGSEKEISAALANASPDTLLKLKQAEMDFQAKMKELDIDLARIVEEDKASARAREIAIAQVGKKDITPKAMAWIAMIGFFVVFYALFIKPMPEGLPRDAILILLGTLTKIVSDIYGYYFGSSASSDHKTELIGNLVNRQGK